MIRLYSARQITSVTRFTLEQLRYLRDIALVLPCCPADGGEDDRYDDVNLLRLQQIRVGRARCLALEEIRRWLRHGDCGLPLSSLQSLDSLVADRERRPAECGPRAPRAGTRRLFLQTEAKVETDDERRAFQAEAAELYALLASLRAAGATPACAALARWAERHRFHIERWFCPCAESEHLAFARGIANNALLSANIERHGAQLTAFLLRVLRVLRERASLPPSPGCGFERPPGAPCAPHCAVPDASQG